MGAIFDEYLVFAVQEQGPDVELVVSGNKSTPAMKRPTALRWSI